MALEAGSEVAAVVRPHSRREGEVPPGCVILYGDLEDSLRSILDPADVVVFAAGSGSSTPEAATLSVDRDGAVRLVDDAASVGVRRFVMLSSMGVDTPEFLPGPLRPYLRAKATADAHLQRSGMDHVILRPARLTFDPGSGTASPSPDASIFMPISRDDVAAAIFWSVSHAPSGAVLELMGGNAPLERVLSRLGSGGRP